MVTVAQIVKVYLKVYNPQTPFIYDNYDSFDSYIYRINYLYNPKMGTKVN